MTTIPSTAAAGVPAPPRGGGNDWLAQEMNRQHRAGIPNLDNVGGGAIDVDHDDAVCEECGDLFQPADGETQQVCDSCDLTEPDEEPHPYVCPTCGGNGCRTCNGSGELVEWTR